MAGQSGQIKKKLYLFRNQKPQMILRWLKLQDHRRIQTVQLVERDQGIVYSIQVVKMYQPMI